MNFQYIVNWSSEHFLHWIAIFYEFRLFLGENAIYYITMDFWRSVSALYFFLSLRKNSEDCVYCRRWILRMDVITLQNQPTHTQKSRYEMKRRIYNNIRWINIEYARRQKQMNDEERKSHNWTSKRTSERTNERCNKCNMINKKEHVIEAIVEQPHIIHKFRVLFAAAGWTSVEQQDREWTKLRANRLISQSQSACILFRIGLMPIV